MTVSKIYVSSSDFKSGPGGFSPRDSVSVFDFDDSSGAFSHVQTIGGVSNPYYMGMNRRAPVLYTVERWSNPDNVQATPEQQQRGDGLRAFGIDPQDGTLREIGWHNSGGVCPIHMTVHPDGRYACVVNPGKPREPDPGRGHLALVKLGDDGIPSAIADSVTMIGRDSSWAEYRKPYPHSVFADPQWRRVFVCDMKLDLVRMFKVDTTNGRLLPSEQPFAQISTGAGPRHMAFRPDGRNFYVLNQHDATISVFNYDMDSGRAEIEQTISFHPEGFPGRRNGAHVLVGPDGRYLYCSHRGDMSLAIFRIDQATGALTLVGHRKSLGDRPRDFAFSPSGRFLLVTNQHADSVVSFHVDPDTGDLTPTGHSINIHSPNCVLFGSPQAEA